MKPAALSGADAARALLSRRSHTMMMAASTTSPAMKPPITAPATAPALVLSVDAAGVGVVLALVVVAVVVVVEVEVDVLDMDVVDVDVDVDVDVNTVVEFGVIRSSLTVKLQLSSNVDSKRVVFAAHVTLSGNDWRLKISPLFTLQLIAELFSRPQVSLITAVL